MGSWNKKLSITEHRLSLQFRVFSLLLVLVPLMVFIYLLARNGLLARLSDSDELVILLLAVLIVLGTLALLQSLFNNLMRIAQAVKQGSKEALEEIAAQETADELKEIASGFEQLLHGYQQTQEKLEHQTFELLMIKELSEEAGKSLDERHLLSILLDKLMRLTRAGVGSVFLFEETSSRFRIVDARGKRSAMMQGLEVDVDQSAASWVAKHLKPLLVEDIAADKRLHRENDPKYASPSFLSLPIVLGDELLAVVNLSDKEKKKPFTRTDLTSSMVMIQEVRFALENAHMYSELQKSAARLEEQNEILQDEIRKRLKVERQLEHLAHMDSLTGLANRYLFMDRLEMMLAQARRHRTKVAVMFIDLDRFKNINDTLGHSVGDMVLQSAARRLKRALREMDLISRYGGDEFTLALPDIADAEDAGIVADKLTALLSEPFILQEREYHLGASIGISVFPDDAESVEDLIKYADAAMYAAKRDDGGGFRFYTADLGDKAELLVEMEMNLRKAIGESEFILHYQPLVDLQDGRLRGMEVLVRWMHPEKGLIPPDQFIPFAERNGLICPIGSWVMRTACRQHQQWCEQGLFADDNIPVITVNVSSVQFRESGFIDEVRNVLDQTGIRAEYLELEITEGVVMEQAEESIAQLHRLKDMGVKLAIDDFGTGFSSLSYLKQFPIDMLKVDRSFVRRVPEHEQDTSIVNAIIDLAHNLNVGVIAEGIENVEQLQFLKRGKCEWGQGYLFSRPLSTQDMGEMIRDENRHARWQALLEG